MTGGVLSDLLPFLPFASATIAAAISIVLTVNAIRALRAQIHARRKLLIQAMENKELREIVEKIRRSEGDHSIELRMNETAEIIGNALKSSGLSEDERRLVENGLRQSNPEAEIRFIRRLTAA